MTNRKTTKKALIFSALSLLLCFSMLIGTTFAWFTDSVTSSGNIIKSGTLNVGMYWADGAKAVPTADADWTDASTGAIFNYDKWEPGYTEVRHIKIANEGTLALKYSITIEPTGKVEELAEVIDVYFIDPAAQVTGRAELTDANKIGTLSYVLDNMTELSRKTMSAGEVDTVTIALKMQETAGNEYQNKKIGDSFAIKLLATQLTAENDSFDNNYDKDAWIDGWKVHTAQDLQAAINNGVTNIVLEKDIEVDGPIVIPAPANTTYSMRSTPAATVINLNGKKIVADANTYAFNNLGNLILKDSVGTGSINARGIYNGYGQGGENVSTARMIVDNIEINALGTNGGAAIFNYGTVEITGGSFTSNGGYGLNNQAGAKMTISNANVRGGVYNLGDLTVNNSTVYQHISGRHAIYNWSGSVVVNGGNYDSISGNELILADGEGASVVINSGIFNKTAKSWLFGAATGKNITFTINGGTFNGYVNLPEGSVDTIRPYGDPIVVCGGTFNFDPTNWLADGIVAVKHNGLYYVANPSVIEGADLLISTADDLKAFADSVNGGNSYAGKTVVLLADIDLGGATWNPIGVSSGKGFSGTFDGQGHTISNFVLATSSGNYGAGFFGNLLGGSAIKNVNFDTVSYTVRSNVVGVVSGYLYGSATFENINVTNIDVQAFAKVGGILGLAADPGAHTITMTDCSVEGVIGGGYNVGGLIGLVLEGQTVNLTNCETDVVFYMDDSGYYYPYVQTENGWMWNYGNQWLYAGVAEQYCYRDAQSKELCMGEPAEMYFVADTVAKLQGVVNSTGGTVNVVLTKDINGDITINQDLKTNLVIDGNGHTYNGTITIKAQSDTTAAASITFKNINFKTADAERTFISSFETNHYPLNVTVSGCTFEGAGADSNVVGISVKSAKNLVIENCTATKMHSILQNNSGWNLTIRDVTVTESGRGVALGTVQGVAITNLTVEAAKYGIRMDAGYNNNAVITDCNIKAFIPVVVRKVSINSTVTFNGTNTMVETNADGLWCAIGTSEYETNGTMPTAATKTVTVVLNDTDLDANGLYNNSGK